MSRILNPREEEIMHVLWQLKRAFVKDILEELPEPKPPYNTVSSVVRKLESEGIIGHQAYGNTHQYFAILQKTNYRKLMIGRVIRNYFSGSPESLLSHFVKEEKIDIDELKKILDQLKEEE
ncbi:MAG: BlaI/MecI/CopY family transcriptional regulator [Saprospiraceae bacterium]|nr:BlaI/MecI/CopY family transcriptional regulator [Saprospiraceae bacterium]